MIRPPKPLLAAAALVLLAGCDTLQPPYDEVRILGDPATQSSPVEPLTAPDSVVAGTPFTVTVVTQGGGCHKRPNDVEVNATGEALELRPYDIVLVARDGETICTLPLRHLTHTAIVTLSEPGRRVLRVVGTRRGWPDAAEVVVERTVVVRRP